jgi:transposase
MEKQRKRGKFPEEVRERAVRLVRESEGGHASQWAALVSVSGKIGCTAETLRRWVRESEIDAGVRPGVTSDMSARVKELEREVRELRQANEILKKASAYFAQAELDRPWRK